MDASLPPTQDEECYSINFLIWLSNTRFSQAHCWQMDLPTINFSLELSAHSILCKDFLIQYEEFAVYFDIQKPLRHGPILPSHTFLSIVPLHKLFILPTFLAIYMGMQNPCLLSRHL